MPLSSSSAQQLEQEIFRPGRRDSLWYHNGKQRIWRIPVVEESGAIPRPCEGGMEEEQHAAGAVLQRPPSPAAQRQEALGLAATDIQSTFRGYRCRVKKRHAIDLRESVRDLAASTLQAVARSFMAGRRSSRRKPWQQVKEVRQLAATCLQSAFRGFRTRRRSPLGVEASAKDLDDSPINAFSEADWCVGDDQMEVEEQQPQQWEDEERITARVENVWAGPASSGSPCASPRPYVLTTPPASPPRAHMEEEEGEEAPMAAEEEEHADEVEEDDDGLLLAMSMNATSITGLTQTAAEAADTSLLPPPPPGEATPAEPLTIEIGGGGEDAGGPASQASRAPREGPRSSVSTRGGSSRQHKAVLLIKMARERRSAVQAAYRCACEAVSQSVSLREAELRIVLQGIGIDLPPPTPAPPTTHAAPLADLQLASTAELADSLKAACIRMGLPAEVVVQVTNKKAELARRHMLKMIKGVSALHSLLLDYSSQPVREWGEDQVLRLLESLELPATVQQSARGLGLEGAAVLLSINRDVAGELGVKSAVLRRRLQLLQLSLHGLDEWETKGLWPGSTPLHASTITRLAASRRGLSKSSGAATTTSNDSGPSPVRLRSSTLPPPPRSAAVSSSQSQAAASEPVAATPQVEPPEPPSLEGLTRMNLATIKKGAYLVISPAEELSRIYRAAWRAHGLGEEAAALPSLDELVGELEAKGVGGRYGRIVSTTSSLPSYSFVKVEVYRPVDPLASLWIVRMPEDDEQQDHEEVQRRLEDEYIDVVDLPIRALFHAPAGLVRPFAIQPQVLRLARRVRVVDEDRLKLCLDRAADVWVDSDSTYRDILSLAGQHAEVICLREARGSLQRVGIRTATGLEDAVPLTAIEPLTLDPAKPGKRRRSSTGSTRTAAALPSGPVTPVLPPSRPAHRRRHSLASTISSAVPSPLHIPAPSSPSRPTPNDRRRRRPSSPTSSTPLAPKTVDTATCTPPLSPPPSTIAFPAIPSRLSRLQPPPPSLSARRAEQKAEDPLTMDEEEEAMLLSSLNDRKPPSAPMAVQVKHRPATQAVDEPAAACAVAVCDEPTQAAGGLDAMLQDKRVRRSSDPGPTTHHRQHSSSRGGTVPPMAVPLHKHALALSPVKLTFLSPRPAGEAPHHRQAPSLTMNKAPVAVKPRPASASTKRARRESWGAGSSPVKRDAHHQQQQQQDQQQQRRRPRPRSASYGGSSVRQSLMEKLERQYLHPQGGDDQDEEEQQARQQGEGGAAEQQAGSEGQQQADDGDTRRWSSRWSRFRGRPIYRPPAAQETEGGNKEQPPETFETREDAQAELDDRGHDEANGGAGGRHRRGSRATASTSWSTAASEAMAGKPGRSSLEAKLRAIERQSMARMEKIARVVERLKASPNIANL